jgi:hypothetical protein
MTQALVRGPFIYPSVLQLDGKKKAMDGECAKLIQWYMERIGRPVGTTNYWIDGGPVVTYRGRAGAVKFGTAIATFNKFGRYDGKAHGNHAAFYLSHNKDGLLIMEQYASAPTIQQRRLPYLGKNPDGTYVNPSNNGSAFSVLYSLYPGEAT